MAADVMQGWHDLFVAEAGAAAARAGHAEGVGGIAPGVLLSFAAGSFGASVLHIEIQR